MGAIPNGILGRLCTEKWPYWQMECRTEVDSHQFENVIRRHQIIDDNECLWRVEDGSRFIPSQFVERFSKETRETRCRRNALIGKKRYQDSIE